jgi:hypothetical protein|uniref:Uncharacterized protein n=1 Tax=Zea mays TaxID=4577 RepID=A0A804PNE6_MAIZE
MQQSSASSTDLDGVVVAVAREAEGAERAVHAVEAVHVALALVRVGVDPALDEEARAQQRLQPRRPPPVLGVDVVSAPAASLRAQTVPDTHTHLNSVQHSNVATETDQPRTTKTEQRKNERNQLPWHLCSSVRDAPRGLSPSRRC